MHRVFSLWRTTTVRLTALFILIFVVFSIALLSYVAVRSSFSLQQVQTREVAWEIRQLRDLDRQRGVRALAMTVQRLASRPGSGIYYLGTPLGEMIAGNLRTIPSNVLANEGRYSLSYSPEDAFGSVGIIRGENAPRRRGGTATVQSVILDSGMRLVVGRDIVQRRDFADIIFTTMAVGVGGIIILSAIAGGLTAMRVLARIDTITATSNKIMSGNLSERVPITKRNDEFDQLATSLNDMLDRIEQLMQGLKEVTDNVAHDLKTPLTRLRNRAEAALRDGKKSKDHKQALRATIEESDRLISTFNALLLIARVEAGSNPVTLHDVNVSEVVADVAELYTPVAEDAGVRLETMITPDIKLRASRELLSQALVNLLENAIKYATNQNVDQKSADSGAKGGTESSAGSDPDGAKNNDPESGKIVGRITIGVRLSEDRAIVEVTDNGPGIPKEQRQRVLERFVRLEKSRTQTGSGLGLSLVSAVAQLHKGSFEIRDNNPGVRAVISLPLGS